MRWGFICCFAIFINEAIKFRDIVHFGPISLSLIEGNV